MVELAKRRYTNKFDFVAAEMWFRNVVLKQPVVFFPIRSDGAFCVALISVIPWMPADPEANLVMLCAEEGCMWQAIGLLREAAAWAQRRKCTELRISSETAVDLTPIAERLGAVKLPDRHALRFEP